MSILLVLIPVTLLFVVVGGIAFFWAVNHDQFDDMDSPALEPLADSDPDVVQDAVRKPEQDAARDAARTPGRAAQVAPQGERQ